MSDTFEASADFCGHCRFKRRGPTFDVYECLGHDVDAENRVVRPGGEAVTVADAVEFTSPTSPFVGGSLVDYWEVDASEQKVIRRHVGIRTTLFNPC